MKPRSFIIDTNIVVAALITRNPDATVCRLLDTMLDGRLPFLLSPALLAEYRHVLLRDKLVRLHGLSQTEIDDLLTELTANAIWRDPPSFETAPEPGDQHLWDLLHCHPHTLLVTGDQLLLAQPPDPGWVITPRDCVEKYIT